MYIYIYIYIYDCFGATWRWPIEANFVFCGNFLDISFILQCVLGVRCDNISDRTLNQ